LPFFLWGVDSEVEDKRRKGALRIVEPPNPKGIGTIRPNAKSMRFLIIFEPTEEAIRSGRSSCKACEP